jgi:hypothetical protein
LSRESVSGERLRWEASSFFGRLEAEYKGMFLIEVNARPAAGAYI